MIVIEVQCAGDPAGAVVRSGIRMTSGRISHDIYVPWRECCTSGLRKTLLAENTITRRCERPVFLTNAVKAGLSWQGIHAPETETPLV